MTNGRLIFDNMTKKTIVILGANGMLGRYLTTYYKQFYNVIPVTRKEFKVSQHTTEWNISNFFKNLDTSIDCVINCVGVIKPQVKIVGEAETIAINSIFPRLLANVLAANNIPLCHITTDCVFLGKKGCYTEKSSHDADDVYGKSKSLGEPENCAVLRTSIIGEEVGNSRSLIEWVKSMAGKEAKGFVNHIWNGVTCLQLAKILKVYIDSGNWWQGVKHFHANDVTKQELLEQIADAFNLNIKVVPAYADQYCNRTLKTVYPLDKIPNIDIQLKELATYSDKLKELY